MNQRRNRQPNSTRAKTPITLAIDIGGTGMKAIKLDANGREISDRVRIRTPKKATPKKVLRVIEELAEAQEGFDRVSVGFPGVIKNGVVYTAANLAGGWVGFDLAKEVAKRLRKPTRVANDADVQGFGCVSGKGVELVITLGTGFGSVIFVDGTPIHLELGHHPFHRGRTYEEELGVRSLERVGKKKWNKMLQEALADLQQTFNYDRLYLGGGNARDIKFKLPDNVKIVGNIEGLLGGIKLWSHDEGEHPRH